MLLLTPKQNSNVPTERRCLAVNAAFLQEVKEDNRFLDELLLAQRDALTDHRLSAVRVRPMVELLRRLRDRLAMHFSMEEAFGYFDDAIDFPMDWSQEAARFRTQHSVLYLELCDIVEAAEQLLYYESLAPTEQTIQRVAYAFAGFYRRLQQHDAGEYELIDRILKRQSVERSQQQKGVLIE